jgi:hypothetical protein
MYIQRLPQRSPDSAVTGPVEMGTIPMRATASTEGSKPVTVCITSGSKKAKSHWISIFLSAAGQLVAS